MMERIIIDMSWTNENFTDTKKAIRIFI